MAMERIGTIYMNMNKADDAKAILEKALEICERRFGINDTTADIIYALGCIHVMQSRSGCGGVDQIEAEGLLFVFFFSFQISYFSKFCL